MKLNTTCRYFRRLRSISRGTGRSSRMSLCLPRQFNSTTTRLPPSPPPSPPQQSLRASSTTKLHHFSRPRVKRNWRRTGVAPIPNHDTCVVLMNASDGWQSRAPSTPDRFNTIHLFQPTIGGQSVEWEDCTRMDPKIAPENLPLQDESREDQSVTPPILSTSFAGVEAIGVDSEYCERNFSVGNERESLRRSSQFSFDAWVKDVLTVASRDEWMKDHVPNAEDTDKINDSSVYTLNSLLKDFKVVQSIYSMSEPKLFCSNKLLKRVMIQNMMERIVRETPELFQYV